MNMVITFKLLIRLKKAQRICEAKKARSLDTERHACLSPCDGRQVAEDRPVCVRPRTGRRDCYWLYVVKNCKSQACFQEPIKTPRGLRGMK